MITLSTHFVYQFFRILLSANDQHNPGICEQCNAMQKLNKPQITCYPKYAGLESRFCFCFPHAKEI
jgi:hypothetical protein